MKPQRPQRNTLRTPKEYPLKDIMEHELKSQRTEYKRQKQLEIEYKGNPFGNYRLDYLIENKVIVE